MFIPENIKQYAQQYALGNYIIHPTLANNQALESWIRELKFEQYELPQNRLQQHSRKRNALYTFHLSAIDKDVVLKVSSISEHYRWHRKLNLLLVGLIKNYSLNAYYGGIALEQIGIESIKVLAHWTCKRQQQSTRSYLLYEKVPATMSVHELCIKLRKQNPDATEIIQSIAKKIAAIVRQIHTNNIRHGDPHAGNFLLNLPNSDISQFSAKDVHKLTFSLIDLDKIHFANNETNILKKVRDIRCLRRFKVDTVEGVNALHYYLQRSPNLLEKMTLKFWMKGGFNFYKWIKPSKKRR